MSNACLTYEYLQQLSAQFKAPFVGFTMQPSFYRRLRGESSFGGYPVMSASTNYEIPQISAEHYILSNQEEPCLQWSDRAAMLKFVRKTDRRRFRFSRRVK